jgi:hypothetical protein
MHFANFNSSAVIQPPLRQYFLVEPFSLHSELSYDVELPTIVSKKNQKKTNKGQRGGNARIHSQQL